MNKERRNLLNTIREQLEAIKDRLENVQDDEQTAFSNMPESLQAGEKAQDIETRAAELICAVDYLQDAINSIETAIV